jgi:hypothetical protein
MANVCFKLTASKFDPENRSIVNPETVEYFCADESGTYLNPDGTSYSPHRVVYLVLGGVTSPGKIYRATATAKLEKIGTDCSNCGSASTPPPGINPTQPYDCVNGGCVPKTTYSTPGKYASLAACQSGCAKDSPCTGECVPVTDVNALQQAAIKAKANCCK